jgi:hypothetical protein
MPDQKILLLTFMALIVNVYHKKWKNLHLIEKIMHFLSNEIKQVILINYVYIINKLKCVLEKILKFKMKNYFINKKNHFDFDYTC